MSEILLTDMCRLCLSKDTLYWVFDSRFENEDNMKNMIWITTGVNINTTDVVSQNVCDKCCRAIVYMFKFRKNSLEIDRRLKEELKKFNKVKEEIPNDHLQSEVDNTKPSLAIHPSMMQLFQSHPNIKLPNMCLTTHIEPMVVMPMDAVENYYKNRRLNYAEHCRLALKIKNTARKKTFKPSIAKHVDAENFPCQINGQIIPQSVEGADDNVLRPIKIRISKAPGTGVEQREETDAPCNKKRKIEVENSSTKENEEPREHNHSTPTSETSKSLSYITNVSMLLHICNICESVHSTSKDLKKHQHKHLRCQFCRTSFPTLESKTKHLEGSCLIKNTINNFPCIELPRIENDKDVVSKYPGAFTDFPSLLDIENVSSATVTLNSQPEEGCSEDVVEIIEILSDDDDVSPQCDTPAATTASKATPAIKPDVRIINNSFPGITDAESGGPLVLKNMLSAYKLLTTDKDTQTDLHDQLGAVEVDEDKLTAVFPNLQRHMEIFRVPVKIDHGPFSASYQHSTEVPPQPTRSENLRLWNDLTPIDIKRNITKDAVITGSNPADGSVSLSSTDVEQNICTIVEDDDTSVDSPVVCITAPQEPRDSSPTAASIFTTAAKDVDALVSCTVANVVQSSSSSVVAPIASKTTFAKPVQFKMTTLRKLIPLSKFSNIFSDKNTKSNQLSTTGKLFNYSNIQPTILPGPSTSSINQSTTTSEPPKPSNDASGMSFTANNTSSASPLLEQSFPTPSNESDEVEIIDCPPINTVTSQAIVDPKGNVNTSQSIVCPSNSPSVLPITQHPSVTGSNSITGQYVTKPVSYLSTTPGLPPLPYITNIGSIVSCATTLRNYRPSSLKSTSECLSSPSTSGTSPSTYSTTVSNPCTYVAAHSNSAVNNGVRRHSFANPTHPYVPRASEPHQPRAYSYPSVDQQVQTYPINAQNHDITYSTLLHSLCQKRSSSSDNQHPYKQIMPKPVETLRSPTGIGSSIHHYPSVAEIIEQINVLNPPNAVIQCDGAITRRPPPAYSDNRSKSNATATTSKDFQASTTSTFTQINAIPTTSSANYAASAQFCQIRVRSIQELT